jgi:hypothetical protein
MGKITQLTEAQQALLPKFRSEWFRVGTCTDRADRSKAEAAILAMRDEIGVATKPIFIWCESPATSLLALHVLKSEQWKKFVRELPGKIPQDPGDSLWASLRDSLWDSLWDSLRNSLRNSLRDSLRASLWDSLWASLRASLGDSLRASLRDSLGDSLGSEWWGQHEAYWIAFYLFCRDIVGVRYDQKRSRQLNMWRDIAQSCCWWWCFENYVVISERPTACHMTEAEGRLHCEDGQALAFSDGYSLYSWHGVNIPDDVVLHPEQLTVARIDAENNAEVRRVMLERYGEARYLQDSGAKPIHRDKSGVLFRKEIPGDEALVMVRVVNSTAEPDGHFKIYYLRVPPTIETARAAVAWTFGIEAKNYKPAVET